MDLFSLIDVDQDKNIDSNDLIQFMKALRIRLTNDEANLIINEFDANKDG